MRSSLVILLCVALTLSLLSPEVEGGVVRGNRRAGVINRRKSGQKQRGRKIPIRRRKGRWSDADVESDDSTGNDAETADAGKAEGAVGAAGALGDLAGICEILTGGRGLTASSLSRTVELDAQMFYMFHLRTNKRLFNLNH
jgi:hypothetical protein